MKAKKHDLSNPRHFGIVLLIIGTSLLAISLLLNVLFIDNEFKTEFRQNQYDECIERENSQDICEDKFLD